MKMVMLIQIHIISVQKALKNIINAVEVSYYDRKSKSRKNDKQCDCIAQDSAFNENELLRGFN